MRASQPGRPEWGRLYDVAAGQGGYFDARQAQEAGYSLPLLAHHIKRGRIQRVRRGIFRLEHYPAGESEDLIILWLWTKRAGVFSHETALALHGLSDALPAIHHLTLPAAWAHRRLRIPAGVRLHYADITGADQTWVGVVPVTSALRTLIDCIADHVLPEFIQSAYRQILHQGLADPSELQSRVRMWPPADKSASS